MLCKIADLLVEVPEAGGMAPRCRDYLHEEETKPHIIIYEKSYDPDYWEGLPLTDVPYMASGLQFYLHLLHHNGMMLHASAVAMDGRAYLFSGHCGMGKSTHTRLWQSAFGEAAQVINDDKPALRRLEDRWYAYGTPWCGKDGINLNQKLPLGGICFLKRGEENRIRRLTPPEVVGQFMAQTTNKLFVREMDLLLGLLDRLVEEIPVFVLECRPDEAAARLSFETMRRSAEEAGL